MYRLSSEVRLRESADGSFWAFRLDDGDHYELTETAYTVLCSLDGEKDHVELACELATTYEVNEEQARDDVIRLLSTCQKARLIERED